MTLNDLQGGWVSDTGKHYDAVLSGDELEFRIRDPGEFPAQNYIEHDVRFTLRPLPGRAYFAVDDKIRPLPPVGMTYEPGSRGTCQAVWSDVDGRPLEARFAAGRLSVDLAKIQPAPSVFQAKANKISSCRALRGTRAEKIESTLRRE